jgi:hypothetical protein
MQEDGFDIPPWTAENLDRKDLLSMWKSITHALISTGHVAELHQELDHASRTGREGLSSGDQWAVESCCDPALLSNESLQTTANYTKNNRSACGYDDEESIDGDTVMSSPGESDIEDDDLCDISPNFIAEAADLSQHHNPLLPGPADHPYMKEVQMRVLAERANDLSGSTDLHQKVVKKALKGSSINWVNGTRALNKEEQQSYLASFDSTLRPEELSLQNTADVLRDGVDGLSERNNAIYICLVPYEGPPNGKRKLDGTPASRTVVAPCPVIPIQSGDFLGVMSGQLRYTPEVGRSDKAIQEPDSKLWLDFSEITGKLSCMLVGLLKKQTGISQFNSNNITFGEIIDLLTHPTTYRSTVAECCLRSQISVPPTSDRILLHLVVLVLLASIPSRLGPSPRHT